MQSTGERAFSVPTLAIPDGQSVSQSDCAQIGAQSRGASTKKASHLVVHLNNLPNVSLHKSDVEIG